MVIAISLVFVCVWVVVCGGTCKKSRCDRVHVECREQNAEMQDWRCRIGGKESCRVQSGCRVQRWWCRGAEVQRCRGEEVQRCR